MPFFWRIAAFHVSPFRQIVQIFTNLKKFKNPVRKPVFILLIRVKGSSRLLPLSDEERRWIDGENEGDRFWPRRGGDRYEIGRGLVVAHVALCADLHTRDKQTVKTAEMYSYNPML